MHYKIATYIGSRCLGQGIILNSWGNEIMKFSSSGIKKSINVLLKWPWIATTAKDIPAKYVKESPTKTSLGYALK